MDSKLIKDYQNPSLFVSIVEANKIIENQKSTIKNKQKHYGFCLNQQKIEDEIHYYETAILRINPQSDKEDITLLKERVSKLEEILGRLLAEKLE